MWNDTAFTRRFERRYPIVQGPFGGGLSSTRLAATVSEAGGLGSFGLQGLTPDRIRAVIAEIQALTREPFAVNLWVSTADARVEDVTRPHVLNHVLRSFDFYKLHVFSEKPFPGYR